MAILKYRILLIAFLILFFSSCTSASRKEKKDPRKEQIETSPLTTLEEKKHTPAKSRMATQLDSLGFFNITDIDSTIQTALMYAQPDNFTKQVLYDDLKEAYLHPEAAIALKEAHEILKRLHPSYRFIIYDAARPMSVQKKMWNIVKGTPQYMYVSNPAHGGGLHNYGLAVDLSILDSLGTPLSMGTKVDHFGIEAHITGEGELVRQGKMSKEEQQNRVLLRQVMKEAGFRALPSEWWHFNLYSREVARRKYPLIP